MPEVKKILITGSTGYIGKYLADRLKAHGYAVIYGSRRLWLSGPVDYVVHCAGVKPAPGVTIDDYIYGNIKYLNLVVKYAESAGVKKFIYISTDLAYHPDEYKWPAYSTTKYLGELMIKDRNFKFEIVRLSKVDSNEKLFNLYRQILRYI